MAAGSQDFARSPATIEAAEHDPDLDLKRVLLIGLNGSGQAVAVSVNDDGEVSVAVTATPALVGTTPASATVSIDTDGDTVLAANADRKRAWIQNTGADFVRLEYGDTPAADSPIRLVPEVGAHAIEPTAAGHIYVGEVTAIAEAGTNAVVVLEET